MRVFIIFFIIFSLQSLVKADDIREFQIESISVGEYMTKYFSEKELNNKKYIWHYPNSKKFTLWLSVNKKYKNYNVLQFHYKTNQPEKYKIVSVQGQISYYDDIENCYPKKKEIYNELINLFPNIKPINTNIKHNLDNKSLVDRSMFMFNNGSISLECYDWAKDIEHKYGDKLALSINSIEFMDWLDNEVYK